MRIEDYFNFSLFFSLTMFAYPSDAFLDKFGDDQLLRLRDLAS